MSPAPNAVKNLESASRQSMMTDFASAMASSDDNAADYWLDLRKLDIDSRERLYAAAAEIVDCLHEPCKCAAFMHFAAQMFNAGGKA